ncbi:hypothetical protein ACB092_09G131400 [Castanea dentata]
MAVPVTRRPKILGDTIHKCYIQKRRSRQNREDAYSKVDVTYWTKFSTAGLQCINECYTWNGRYMQTRC